MQLIEKIVVRANPSYSTSVILVGADSFICLAC